MAHEKPLEVNVRDVDPPLSEAEVKQRLAAVGRILSAAWQRLQAKAKEEESYAREKEEQG